jgi:hypothetical protein
VTIWASAGRETDATKEARSHERYTPGPIRNQDTSIFELVLKDPGPSVRAKGESALSAKILPPHWNQKPGYSTSNWSYWRPNYKRDSPLVKGLPTSGSGVKSTTTPIPLESKVSTSSAASSQLESFLLVRWASRRPRDLLELLDRLNPTISELTQAVEQEVEKCPEEQRLNTHPGVGAPTALAFVLIIGKAERFRCRKQVASYLGLVPLGDSGGNRQRLGHITKQGSFDVVLLAGGSGRGNESEIAFFYESMPKCARKRLTPATLVREAFSANNGGNKCNYHQVRPV